LHKISVERQSLGRHGFPHHHKRDVIHHTPVFIIVLFISRKTALEQTMVYFNRFDILSAAQNPNDLDAFFSEVFG
jgi:hypothetical protein